MATASTPAAAAAAAAHVHDQAGNSVDVRPAEVDRWAAVRALVGADNVHRCRDYLLKSERSEEIGVIEPRVGRAWHTCSLPGLRC